MLNNLKSALNRTYLVVRQQYRHLQACAAHASPIRFHSPPPVRFVIFGRGRSGTTALVSLLDGLPDVRCEGEVLHDFVPFPYVHVLGRRARIHARAYGCKILSYQIRDVQSCLKAPQEFIRSLHRNDGFQILYLRRTNLLRHALSNIRARRQGFHQKKSGPKQDRPPLHVDPENVLDWIENSQALMEYEQRLLENVPYLSLTYEQHLRDPAQHQSTVDEIAEYLGIESAPVESGYEKVAPRSLRDGVANYDELARHLANTPYAEYLV